MKKIVILSIICFSFWAQKAYAVSVCPRVYWHTVESDCYQENDVNLGVAFCPSALIDASNITFNYVEWDFDDGTPIIQTTSLSVVHHYVNDGDYLLNVTVHFTVDGVPCVVVPINLLGTGSPYGLLTTQDVGLFCSDIPIVPNYEMTVRVATLDVDLWLETPEPYVAGQQVDFGVYVSNLVGANPWHYDLSINNTPFDAGFFSTTGVQDIVPLYTIPTIPSESQYVAEIILTNTKIPGCTRTKTIVFDVQAEEPPPPCEHCLTFRPDPNKRYWVSGWVKVLDANASQNSIPQVISYDNGANGNTAGIELSFVGSGTTFYFRPSGDIIEGWQRIAGEFTTPNGATEVNIKLNNPNTAANPPKVAYFDDIRIHPFNGSMKSYVNDPDTFWLTAELDDNNYATFYEYDMEGKLIRIKKETNKGVVTIKENRSSNPKTN